MLWPNNNIARSNLTSLSGSTSMISRPGKSVLAFPALMGCLYSHSTFMVYKIATLIDGRDVFVNKASGSTNYHKPCMVAGILLISVAIFGVIYNFTYFLGFWEVEDYSNLRNLNSINSFRLLYYVITFLGSMALIAAGTVSLKQTNRLKQAEMPSPGNTLNAALNIAVGGILLICQIIESSFDMIILQREREWGRFDPNIRTHLAFEKIIIGLLLIIAFLLVLNIMVRLRKMDIRFMQLVSASGIVLNIYFFVGMHTLFWEYNPFVSYNPYGAFSMNRPPGLLTAFLCWGSLCAFYILRGLLLMKTPGSQESESEHTASEGQ